MKYVPDMLMNQSNGRGCHKLACLIVGRNLGDAVIQSKFMRKLIESGYADRYVVWTRPQVSFLYASLPDCTVITSPFPIGTNKQFDRKGFFRFCKAVSDLRQLKPSVSLDLIGDFRERLFARFIGNQPHKYIGWESRHPFSRIIRNPFGAPAPVCRIPDSISNIYTAYECFIDALLHGERLSHFVSTPVSVVTSTALRHKRVGLHPFASLECKVWPDTNWRELATWLQAKGMSVTVYGAPGEREALLRIFDRLPIQPEYYTRTIPEFDRDVANLYLLIGLDSFSVHMAERHEIKSIMLNACNHPSLWRPPHCESITESGGCRSYPCMNVPNCSPGPNEYACIRAITPDQVIGKVHELLAL